MSHQWMEITERDADEYMKVWLTTRMLEVCGDSDTPIEEHPKVLKAFKNKKYQLSIGKKDQSFMIWETMQHELHVLNNQKTKSEKIIEKLNKKLDMKQRMVQGLLTKLNSK